MLLQETLLNDNIPVSEVPGGGGVHGGHFHPKDECVLTNPSLRYDWILMAMIEFARTNIWQMWRLLDYIGTLLLWWWDVPWSEVSQVSVPWREVLLDQMILILFAWTASTMIYCTPSQGQQMGELCSLTRNSFRKCIMWQCIYPMLCLPLCMCLFDSWQCLHHMQEI